MEGNRPRILFEGVSRSEYPTAPSIAMPNSSLGSPGRRLRSTLALVMADSSWKVVGFARAGWYLLQRKTSDAAYRGVWG